MTMKPEAELANLKLQLKATNAQLEAHKGMVQDLYNMNISIRSNNHLLQDGYNEVVQVRKNLTKDIEDLKKQLADMLTNYQAANTEVERLKALLPPEPPVEQPQENAA